MVTEFRLPELGEDIDSGDVISVLIKAGDTVAEEQPVMEIETDKATIEVPAPVSGTIKEIHVEAGTKVKVGQLLFTIDEGGKDEGKETTETKSERDEDKEEREVKGEEIKSKEAKEGKKEKKESKEEKRKESKTESNQEERKPDEVGDEEEGKQEAKEKEVQAEAKEEEKEEEKSERKAVLKEREGEVVEFSRQAKTTAESPKELAPAAPSVRRLAREIGVYIAEVPGSGPGGRITEDDVKNYARMIITRKQDLSAGVHAVQTPLKSQAPLPDFTKWGEIERQPMSNVRRKTAEVMTWAWTTIPHVTQNDKADITSLEKLRKNFGKKAEEAGGKLTVTAILLKVVASALKVFPHFNASVDMASEEIIYKNYYHIGVAVETDRGLFVPVIRDVDKKNIIELSAELVEMSEKARNKKITLEEMKGGTFTISNQGSIGGIYFSPIINWPEVAILGVSRAYVEPVFVNGQFEPRLMLPFSLSHDHRVIDGADAVRFLRWIIEALEEPFKLILEG
ncbi:MAG: 2-oxo acid dehydrogenase subunit E2 [Deltaproteobacteria bacterium]|nr:2-oxo acid dehydrogenase subunit E2 [Deltaproteobacteria bacterium]